MKKIGWMIGILMSLSVGFGLIKNDSLDLSDLWEGKQTDAEKARFKKILSRWDEFSEVLDFNSQKAVLKIIQKDFMGKSVEIKTEPGEGFLHLTSKELKLLLKDIDKRLRKKGAHEKEGLLEDGEFTFIVKYTKNGKECVKRMIYDCDTNKYFEDVNWEAEKEWRLKKILEFYAARGADIKELEP